MRFDDRLLTVLSQPASDHHDSAVRWRQLVDLVARAGPNSATLVVERALESIRTDAAAIDEELRAAAARAVAALPLPLGLLESFASDRLSVSAPVLAAASLDAGQWSALLTNADAETRRFVETLHPELVPEERKREENKREAAENEPEENESEENEQAEESGDVETAQAQIVDTTLVLSPSEVVARIEHRHDSREQHTVYKAMPAAAPEPGAAALFRWECSPSGEIAWVEGAPRGALIGRSLARFDSTAEDGVDDEVARAFAIHAPFRDAWLSIGGEGLVSGRWKISGVPAFEPGNGRFAGYRGVATRDAPPPPGDSLSSEVLTDPDSLRELVHEIKTPLNAIIGFAEIIDGQYLGPADRRYRERAVQIVAQARLLLGAIDDLDFAAKLQSANGAALRRADLGRQVEQLAATLHKLGAERGIDLDLESRPRMLQCAIEPDFAERLMYRLCASVIDHARQGEHLGLSLDDSGGQCRFSISRPACLGDLEEAQIFDSPADADDSDPLESGASALSFSLRLVRGLARIAGGDLVASPAALMLILPRA